jgi:hypothetical protein
MNLVHSSPLTIETPSNLAAMIQASVSVTHDMREEPLVTSSDEKHYESSVLKRSHDSKSLDCALRDHEPFLLKSTLEAQEIVEHLPCGPACEEVYVYMDWVDRHGHTLGYKYNNHHQNVGLSSAHRTPNGTGGHNGVQQYARIFMSI